MAGAGFKTFNTGDVLTASDVNTYLMQQTVMVFADSTARTTALGANVAEGMLSYLKDTNTTAYYDGSVWQTLSTGGDITSVVAGTGLTGGGTSGDVTVSLDLSAANVFSAAQSATSFIVTGSTIPANGIYLNAANSIAFSSNTTKRFEIDANGNAGFGGSPSAGTTLRIAKAITGAVTSFGVYVNNQIQSDVTTSAQMFSTFPSVVDSAFTLGSFTHYSAAQGTKGASATVTNQYGFQAGSSLTGATNNFGFHGNLASATGVWNFYAAGTATNYFAGRTTIGSTVATGYMARVTNTTAADVGLQVRGAASQTGNYFEVVNSAGTTRLQMTANDALIITGSLSVGAPIAKTADFTVGSTESILINNKSGSTCTVTLPTASTTSGRQIEILNWQAQTVVSASSNVVPLAGGAAGTAILAATAGKWAKLVSDGTNWIITSSN